MKVIISLLLFILETVNSECAYFQNRTQALSPNSDVVFYFSLSVNKTIQKHGRIDVVVNNSVYGLFGGVEELSAEDIQKIMQSIYLVTSFASGNFTGAKNLIQEYNTNQLIEMIKKFLSLSKGHPVKVTQAIYNLYQFTSAANHRYH
ncbi:hypothetical protein DICPUDRAFT_159192 [Dictyostelium purpureum]|uniref:Uncharacterized protein n=1 Tax=Dictyostelium purpureum TaxID=5786 RepID=F1A3I1_DICPU|nr:uncharacterized protein DICPUDRAFT_159192 [Dictyostelium purpureum]EGC29253.1 hypothetical protein DICPUDRAFT_159192 [Dictyostelium purpureum]|eukprot:XP_003294222.1 hypothetical protein DICPUDRAFT_159192 [Dictyostelium purpureum]